MSAKKVKLLAVHGVGGHDIDGKWEDRWEQAIHVSIARVSSSAQSEISFVHYDDIFDAQDITASGTFEAVAKLGASGLLHGAGDIWGGVFSRTRARQARPKGIPDRLRWTAGMVVQWAENEPIRAAARKRLAQKIRSVEPDVVLAHSLGSLIAYDTFVRAADADLISGRTFVSFGSQIGNPFVRSQFAGRIVPLRCEHWYHLFNEEDDIFTAPIRLVADNFEQIDCFFDVAGFADHDAGEYLRHTNLSNVVWRELLSSAQFRRASRSARADVKMHGRPRTRPARGRSTDQRRALLVGINTYPNPEERLEGCVNDVFLMSEVLQESGFDASQIRTVLDERATADGIRSRIEWLLDGSQDGDERILYFSGHGSQIMDYGPDETVDRFDECLVPWDFDWTRENAIVDDWFFDLYSQLPYESRFIVVFDCCHSGGMTRAGMGRPKGLAPRDDIRHRELTWDPVNHVWLQRKLESPNKSLSTGKMGEDYLGKSGVKRRLGRATSLLRMDDRRYNTVRKRDGHYGPFLPVIIQACQEDELAYEYRHGATSFGAFTFALAQQLRSPEARDGLSMDDLYERVTQQLRNMGYSQRPNIVGPTKVTQRPVRWCQLRG